MTLYDMANSMTIQGNIEVKVFDFEGELESRFFRDQDDFVPHWTDCEDIEDLTVTYMYAHKSYDGSVWLTIELTKED